MTEKPELSDGHTRIANEIMEVLARTYMSSYESQFLWFLFRKTYGWGKKDDQIPISQIVASTGMHRSHVSRTKKKLIDRRIVTQTGNKIAFNKYHSQWRELPKQVTANRVLPKQVTSVTQTGTKVLPKQALSKEKKETIQKKRVARAAPDDMATAKKLAVALMNTNIAFHQKYSPDSAELQSKVERWALDIEKMIRIDKIPREQVDAMLQWLFQSQGKDALFWRGNVQSGDSLRRQFPRLVSALEREVKQDYGKRAAIIS